MVVLYPFPVLEVLVFAVGSLRSIEQVISALSSGSRNIGNNFFFKGISAKEKED